MLTIHAIEYCKMLSHYHGDIQPKFVMLKPDGTVFLNDILNFQPGKENGYQRMLGNPNYIALLSPQALEELANRNRMPTFDHNKNDVFAIALTVLAAISEVVPGDQGLRTFYVNENGRRRVAYNTINSLLSVLVTTQRRSRLLADTLRIMLSENEQDRPTLYQILEFLRMATA